MNDLSASNPIPDEEVQADDPRVGLSGLSLADYKLPEPALLVQLQRWSESTNIALIGRDEQDEDVAVSDEELNAIGQRCKLEYDIDWNSCAEWREKTKDAMNMALQVTQPKTYPWPKASNIVFPLLTSASFNFAARAYPAIVSGRNVVKGVVIGPDSGVPASMGHNGGPPLDDTQILQGLQPPQGQPGLSSSPLGMAAPQATPPAIQPDQSQQPNQQWLVPPGQKQKRADLIGEHMSYQLLDEQKEWEPEMDTLLHVLPIVGCEFKKSFFDAAVGHNSSFRVPALNLVINYKAKSLERAPRVSEEIKFYPLEIKEMEMAGVFREIMYNGADDQGDDRDAPVDFIEQHRWLDLDDDGYKEPYIVTLHKASSQVVRIVARFDLDGIKWNATKGRIQKIDPIHYYTKYDFLPNPEGGIYGVGFGQLLKPINDAINTTLNMMFDAEHLKVVGGGFIGKGLSMNAGALRFQPGEWKPVNNNGVAIRDAMVPLPAEGASELLFQLLGFLVEAGKEIAGVKDILTGETVPTNTPATTMLAMVEQGLKSFTAIYKRVHRSLKEELAKLYRLNRIYLDQEASYRVGNDWKTITRADYEKGSGVEPISDPTMVSDMQKLGRAEFLLSFLQNPLMDAKKIIQRTFDAAAIPNPDDLFNPNPPPNPEIVETTAKLALEKHKIDGEQALKEKEMNFKLASSARKQEHEEASLQLRARHDEALMESEQARALLARAQALLAVANAEKAVETTGVAWAGHYLDVLKAQMDAIANANTDTTAAEQGPQTVTPGTPEALMTPAPIAPEPMP